MRAFLTGSLTVCLALGLAGRTPAQDDPKAVIEKAIKAQGGAELLEKLKATQLKGRGIIHLPIVRLEIPCTVESYAQFPDQFKQVRSGVARGRNFKHVVLVNGDKMAIIADDKAVDLGPEQKEGLHEQVYTNRVVHLLPLIQDKGFELASQAGTKVEDQDTVGVKVNSKGHRDINLYFDKANGLLLKIEHKVPNERGGEDILEEILLSDYKDQSGIKSPMKEVVYQNGKKHMEMAVTEVKHLEKLDAKVFEP
jgi:hypothetical protein